MRNWLRAKLITQGELLPSADWWEEHGQPNLAFLLRHQANTE